MVRQPKSRGARGIFIVLVDKDSPGLSYGKDWGFWGVYQGLRHDLIFKDCRIPASNLLVDAGQFDKVMMAFNTFRLQNSARTLGMGEGALDAALKWSQKRTQFGKPLCEFQMIQGRLADMAMKIEAARWLLYRAASKGIGEEAPPLETSIAKGYCNEPRSASAIVPVTFSGVWVREGIGHGVAVSPGARDGHRYRHHRDAEREDSQRNAGPQLQPAPERLQPGALSVITGA